MKRFLLFTGMDYEASGGWGDFKGSFGTVTDAVQSLASMTDLYCKDWWHVVDSQTGEIVIHN